MGKNLATVLLPLLPVPALLAQQPAVPVDAVVHADAALDSGLVLVPPGTPTGHGFGLGDGGLGPIDRDKSERSGVPGRYTTPGGVVVDCRAEGARLSFPSGRQLLCAPDGYVHLRDGAVAGPFGGGVELLLLDGTSVRFDRNGSRRTPISEVVVAGDDDRGVRIWRRTQAVLEPTRGGWGGDRLFCLGDGGTLYRALALGPVVTLQRVLAPRGDDSPERRLALLTGPLLDSLQQIADSRARHTDADAIAEVQLILDERKRVFPEQGPPPPRTSTDPLQYLLRAGYDLRLRIESADVLLQIARHEQKPFVEWQLAYGATIRCVAETHGSGPMLTVPPAARVLLPRIERFELVPALKVVEGMQRGGK